MNILLKNNPDKIRECCREHDVEKLYAFGSVMTDDFSDNSDIDLPVKFGEISFEKYADNYSELHEIFEGFSTGKLI